jgi:type VI secretion system protein ImpH
MSDRSGSPVVERLEREGTRYEFFQLVELLLRQRPDTVAPGGAGPAAREGMRFRPSASMGFPSTDIEAVEPEEKDPSRTRITVHFMGLYGPASPMPNHFTEEILWAGSDEQSVRDFLDIFHHRLISLVYRAWAKYRYPLQFESAPLDGFSRRLLCLMGLGTDAMADATGVDVVPLLMTTGALATRRRSAVGLEGFLREHFPDLTIRVVPCVLRRAAIPADQRLRLGGAAPLGRDACLGETAADRAGSFRIEIGPLAVASYRELLPRAERLGRLVRLARLYLADPLRFDVRLVLRGPEVPPLRIGAGSDLPLGQMSWLAPRGDEGRATLSTRRLDPLHGPRASAPHARPAGAAPARGAVPAPSMAPTRRTRDGR